MSRNTFEFGTWGSGGRKHIVDGNKKREVRYIAAI